LCAGGWTPALLAGLGLADEAAPRARPIQVNRFVLSGEVPPLAFLDAASGLYGRADGPEHVLCGLPVAAADETDTVPHSADPACADGAIAALRQRFSFARDAVFAGGWRSFDAYPPALEPLRPRKTAVHGCYLCKGMAGGGIKLAPWFAQALIDMLKE
jgi:glycine/D-amino acid oxidase-like deaminating enzyme